MNKIHRTVWSEARQCFVVASEAAKAKGKPSSKRSAAALKAAVALMALGGAGGALAADLCSGNATTTVSTSGADNCTLDVNGATVTISGAGGLLMPSSAAVSAANGIAAGNLDNSGVVQGSAGIQLQAGSFSMGHIINQSGGTISGQSNSGIVMGVGNAASGITNAGTISTAASNNIGI